MPWLKNGLAISNYHFFKNSSKRNDSSILEHAAGMACFTKKIVNFLHHFLTQKKH
jgi:hypothetical protein